LDKRAGRNHHLRAGIDRRSDLGIDVVSAMHGSALNIMREYKSNPGTGGKRYWG
jgi:hypothetical protein